MIYVPTIARLPKIYRFSCVNLQLLAFAPICARLQPPFALPLCGTLDGIVPVTRVPDTSPKSMSYKLDAYVK